MTDTGKQSALRQTDDGSFEIVLDGSGLQEVSEEEISAAEVDPPEPRQAGAATSSRILVFSVIGVAVLLALTAVGWFALSPDTETAASIDDVPGFKPYAGGGADDDKKLEPGARERLSERAGDDEVREPEAEPEAEAEEVAEEITEDEPGWELAEAAEDGVIVEVEGTDDEPEEEVAELEEEVVDEDPDELDTNSPARSITARRGLNALRGQDVSRKIKPPRVPALNANPLGGQPLKKLPIRSVRAADVDDGQGESGDEEYVDEEAVEGEEVEAEDLR